MLIDRVIAVQVIAD